jgi:hypothetical protein
MDQTKYIHLKPADRKRWLRETAEANAESSYQEKLTVKTKQEEVDLLVEAVRINNFPKAREHAENLYNGIRCVRGEIYKFTNKETQTVGYYNDRGYLVTERPMTWVEISKLEAIK